MSEYAPIIIALAIIVLIVLVIYLGMSYVFEIYKNRRLQEATIGINQSLAKEVKFLENALSSYRHLANKYGCCDAIEFEKLLMDLQDRIYRKDVEK